MYGLRIGKITNLKGLYAVEKRPCWLSVVRVSVDHRASFTGSIPLLTTGYTGVTTNTGIEIDNKRELSHEFTRPFTNACHLLRAGSIPGTLFIDSN